MNTPSQPTEPPTPDCHWVDERLDDYVDGELEMGDTVGVECHLAHCDACNAVLKQLREVKLALGELPAIRCPSHVLDAVRREAMTSEAAARPQRGRRAITYAAALAACLLVAFGAWSIRGAYERHQAELRRERVELALAELQTTLRRRASDVGREAFEHSVAKPTRTVVTAVQQSPLGRWGAAAASLLAPTDAGDTDAT